MYLFWPSLTCKFHFLYGFVDLVNKIRNVYWNWQWYGFPNDRLLNSPAQSSFCPFLTKSFVLKLPQKLGKAGITNHSWDVCHDVSMGSCISVKSKGYTVSTRYDVHQVFLTTNTVPTLTSDMWRTSGTLYSVPVKIFSTGDLGVRQTSF